MAVAPVRAAAQGGHQPPVTSRSTATTAAVLQPLRQATASARRDAGRSAPARRSTRAGRYQTEPAVVTAAAPRARTGWMKRSASPSACPPTCTRGWPLRPIRRRPLNSEIVYRLEVERDAAAADAESP
ncbi:hypothetical protein ACR6C2_37430 [Streptomyces sp. INA 01156]